MQLSTEWVASCDSGRFPAYKQDKSYLDIQINAQATGQEANSCL